MGTPDLTVDPQKARRPIARSAARLGAVQALYQMDLAQTELGEVLAQFSARSSGEDFDDGDCGEADFHLLTNILEGVVREQVALDNKVDSCLATGWTLARLDSTLRAILRAGAYELMFRHDIPPKVSINEYVDVTRAFFDGDEPKFVNGVLDKLARSLSEPRL
jgi:N utilization substance protein B